MEAKIEHYHHLEEVAEFMGSTPKSTGVRKVLEQKVGCCYFWFPCWLALKLGYDGLCISFDLPCLVGWVFTHILKI